MRLVVTSDTHNNMPDVPSGDVFVHCGDLTSGGSLAELSKACVWISRLPHKHKIVVAGNHDWCLYRGDLRNAAEEMLALAGVVYLLDTSVEIGGLKFWGSPFTPAFQRWAFMLKRGKELYDHWQKIPEDVDVLITHGPPKDMFDRNAQGVSCGCDDLAARVEEVAPLVHLFGHIHEEGGKSRKCGRTTFVNAAWVGFGKLGAQPPNAPVVLEV